MVLYIAITAILNLGLGYALAVYMRAGRQQVESPADESDVSEYVESAA
jgi:hypothetical protein